MVCGTTEQSVGITAYLNKNNPGFHGRIKERFSDFNVTEVDLAGNLVSLLPPELTAEEKEEKSRKERAEQINIYDLGYTELPTDIQAILSETKFLALKEIRTGDRKTVDIVVNDLDKEGRTNLHIVIKRFELVSETKTAPNQDKIIQVVKPAKKSGKQDVKRGERGRSKQEKFLHFSLYKENYSTADCISSMARDLRTKDAYFSFAGTKDKRGRTLQRVAVSLIKPESIEAAAKRMKGVVAVGNYSFHPKGLRLGDLKGNRFEIVVKDIDVTEDGIRPVMEHFVEHGYINYFGMQRFGTSEISTHQIGLAILNNDFDKVLDLILSPKENQFPDLREVLEKYQEDKDAEAALESLRGRLQYTLEVRLLKGICRHHANDKVNALKVIPHGIRQMYGHAYQSYVWNSTVSWRMEKYGTQVLEGDLVQQGDMVQQGDSSNRVTVKYVEDPTLYTIYDLYLPLPGHTVTLPKNETAEFMLNLIKEDGLSLSSFRNSTKEYDLPGAYRPIVTKAEDVSWSVVSYSSNEDDLLHSRLEIAKAHNTGEPLRKIGDASGPRKAFIVGMSLNSCCYATMALREIMRVQTDQSSMKSAGFVEEIEEDGDKLIVDNIDEDEESIASAKPGKKEEASAEDSKPPSKKLKIS